MLGKDVLRAGYRALVGASAVVALPFRPRDAALRVFYAGARGGDFGGTLVKVRLLQQRFPERRIGFSLIYMLSNAIYLPLVAVERLRARGIPLVLNQNGVFYPGWYPRGWQRENARMAEMHAAADYVFYQSDFCRRCAGKFLGARSGPTEILYNGVDTAHFTPDDLRERKGPFTFLVTGKFGASTAYRLVSSIEGLGAARNGGLDVRLQIFGLIEPSVEAAARALVERLALTDLVLFGGPYNAAQAPNIYRSADAYLMTKHNDPCPNAVLEAMACGLPVLYSASGGVPEQVGPEAGIGLPVPDTFERDVAPAPGAIAEGMAQIIAHCARMGAAARQRALERFDLSHWLARHERVFRALLGKTA
ncbi:MAG TPA: glycosyltransferase family 4 protein [Pseudolabrys sp.]|nr:glycosyltransferase family 4 protein [Pseudolabrys sp.]